MIMMSEKNTNPLVIPIVKWVGGKRQLLKEIRANLPKEPYKRVIEPFFGGGAVSFSLQKTPLIINDLNEDLIGLYRSVKNQPTELIEALKKHKENLQADSGGGEEYFYEVRAIDRDKTKWNTTPELEKAARLVFLNKTCYNGLFRVNSAGEFNSPYGHYKNPDIVQETKIKAVSAFLNKPGVEILSGDYREALKKARKGDLVYLDPPYDPVSDSASFTGYTAGGFGKDEQEALYEACVALDAKGVSFLLSNSATDYIRDKYKDFNVVSVMANRAVNSVAARRGAVEEVLVKNYE